MTSIWCWKLLFKRRHKPLLLSWKKLNKMVWTPAPLRRWKPILNQLLKLWSRCVKHAIDCRRSERTVATRSPWMVLQRVDRFPRRIRSIHASIVDCRGIGPVTKSVRSLAKDLLAKLEKLQLLPSKCVLQKFVNRTPLPLTPLTQPALYTKLPW